MRVQTIFVKNNEKTFRGGVKTRDISKLLTGHLLRARGRLMGGMGGGGGVIHNVNMTFFSAKIV